MSFDDGDRYEGGFYQGAMSGPGIYHGDGFMFLGEFEGNQKSGCGVAAYMNGAVAVSYTHLTLPTILLV